MSVNLEKQPTVIVEKHDTGIRGDAEWKKGNPRGALEIELKRLLDEQLALSFDFAKVMFELRIKRQRVRGVARMIAHVKQLIRKHDEKRRSA